MKVTLLSHTANPQEIVATAAKLCYSSVGIDKIHENLTPAEVRIFIERLMELGHESPLEHASFTFGIEGISRSCSHQLVRHRIASYSQKSQRYVAEKQFGYVTPAAIAKTAGPYYDDFMKRAQEAYDTLCVELTKIHVNKLIADGVEEKEAMSKARKMAQEDARYVLPNACETSIVVTMNIRSLFNFFKHRTCNRAQWEIREMAMQMYELVCGICPTIFKYAGPSCVTCGKCSEGKMSCGRAEEVKDRFMNTQKEALLHKALGPLVHKESMFDDEEITNYIQEDKESSENK